MRAILSERSKACLAGLVLLELAGCQVPVEGNRLEAYEACMAMAADPLGPLCYQPSDLPLGLTLVPYLTKRVECESMGAAAVRFVDIAQEICADVVVVHEVREMGSSRTVGSFNGFDHVSAYPGKFEGVFCRLARGGLGYSHYPLEPFDPWSDTCEDVVGAVTYRFSRLSGLLPGDLILEIEGEAVSDRYPVDNVARESWLDKSPGELVHMVWNRPGVGRMMANVPLARNGLSLFRRLDTLSQARLNAEGEESGQLGDPRRARIVDRLVAGLADEEHRYWAKQNLTYLGRPTLESLFDALRSDDVDADHEAEVLRVLCCMRGDAERVLAETQCISDAIAVQNLVALAWLIAELGPYTKAGPEVLAQRIDSLAVDWMNRREHQNSTSAPIDFALARDALRGRVVVDVDGSNESLIELIADRTLFAREVAIEELGRRWAQPSVGVISTALTQASFDDVRGRAAKALLRIDPADPRAEPGFVIALNSARDRAELLEVIRRCRYRTRFRSRTITEILLKHAQSWDGELAIEAIGALGSVGTDQSSTSRVLGRLCLSIDPPVAAAAKKAMESITAEK